MLFRPLILVQKPRSRGRMPLIDLLNPSVKNEVFFSQILPERHLIFPIPPNSSHESMKDQGPSCKHLHMVNSGKTDVKDRLQAERTFNDFRIFSRRPSRSPMSSMSQSCNLPLSALIFPSTAAKQQVWYHPVHRGLTTEFN